MNCQPRLSPTSSLVKRAVLANFSNKPFYGMQTKVEGGGQYTIHTFLSAHDNISRNNVLSEVGIQLFLESICAHFDTHFTNTIQADARLGILLNTKFKYPERRSETTS